MMDEEQNKKKQTTLQIYIAALVSAILNFIPISIIQNFAAILFLVILISAYIFRAKEEKGSFLHSHMAYIITSIWISSLFLVIGMGGAFAFGNHTLVNDTADAIMGGMFITEEQMRSLMIDYFRANTIIFILTLGPSIVYLFYRLIKGLKYANKNISMSGIKGWF